jgi:hypothetical protein
LLPDVHFVLLVDDDQWLLADAPDGLSATLINDDFLEATCTIIPDGNPDAVLKETA